MHKNSRKKLTICTKNRLVNCVKIPSSQQNADSFSVLHNRINLFLCNPLNRIENAIITIKCKRLFFVQFLRKEQLYLCIVSKSSQPHNILWIISCSRKDTLFVGVYIKRFTCFVEHSEWVLYGRVDFWRAWKPSHLYDCFRKIVIQKIT